MAADFFIGESLVGDGNEVAHIDLIIGSKAGHAGQAFVNTLSNNTDGFTKLLAVVTPNLPAKPDTLLFNKVTIKNDTLSTTARATAACAGPNIWTACVAFLMVTLLKRRVSGFAGRLGVTTASSLVKPSVLFANVLTKACPAWPDFDPMIKSM